MDSVLLGFLALAVIAASGGLWFRRAMAVRLPRNRAAFVGVWLCGGGLGVLALASGAGWLGGVPAGLAILGACFFCLTVAVSRQRVRPDAVRVGDPLPHFSALDEEAAVFDSALLAGKPLLLKFFRGHW